MVDGEKLRVEAVMFDVESGNTTLRCYIYSTNTCSEIQGLGYNNELNKCDSCAC